MPSANRPAIKKWIDHYLAANPPRAKSVVMTLFGDVITPHGGQLWLGSLIKLLEPFGINDRLVRTSVFRLIEEGWLKAQRVGRRSRYTLDPAALQRFEHAYQRVYVPSNRPWNHQWTMLLATAGALTAQQKADLRKELFWEGFAQIAPSVFAHPNADAVTLEEILLRVGARAKVYVCRALESEVAAARPLRELVQQSWALDAVVADYQCFIASFSTLPKLLKAPGVLDSEQAFVLRTLLLHAFRRVQLRDPQLPLELLPQNWPGLLAYDLCQQIYRLTYRGVEQYVQDILQREDPAAPKAAPYFYQRFGGLV